MFRVISLFIVICAFICAPGSDAFGHGCADCHTKEGVAVKIPSTEPIKLIVDGKETNIGIKDAFKFHGHECPGVTTTFLAIRYGLELLYPDSIPKRDDLLILSGHKARGPIDLIDFVMKGDRQKDRTWPIKGLKKSADAFEFTIIRKSRLMAVKVKLKPEMWPEDFFQLKRKQKQKKITNEEWDRLHDHMKNIILNFPKKPAVELFGAPKPYKTLIWGTIATSEVDDIIKTIRRAGKEGKAKHQ